MNALRIIEYDDRSPGDPSTRSTGLSTVKWLRDNLCSSWFNGFLTVLSTGFLLLVFRSLLNFIFSEQRNWAAVKTNLRLLFVHAYPEEQFSRVWVSLGVIVVLAGLSLGLSARFPAIPLRRIGAWFTTSGGLVVLGLVLMQPSQPSAVDGNAAMSERYLWLSAGFILIGLGAVFSSILKQDSRGRVISVAAIPFAFAVLGVLVAGLWLYPWGRFSFVEGEYLQEPASTVAMSTKIPWMVMWLLLVLSWFVGSVLRPTVISRILRLSINVLWLLVPFFLYWVVLRDPAFDWTHVWSVDIPLALSYAIVGCFVLWFLTRPAAGEFERIVAVLLLFYALFNWVSAFFGWHRPELRIFSYFLGSVPGLQNFLDFLDSVPVLQKERLTVLFLALAALLAHYFRGATAQRLRLISGWFGFILVFNYLVTVVNTPSTIETPTDNFIGGFSVTLIVAVFTLLFSFPIGVLMALARTSRMPIFRLLSTWYIETIRGIPLITILFFFSIMVPLFLPDGMDLNEMAAIIVGYSLFSAAYIAENVRGGLQSVRRGQYEASNALGLTTGQRTAFIVLPQALRVSIPPLVGQLIAVFKETSLIAIVGGFDFLRIADNVIPTQSEFVGARREALLFVSVVYWMVAFSISKYSRRLEKQLGVGK
ncbi:MAG: amino acid ABC transporter permease [Acidimicrobiaceae bacterium]|nr:amino acid ABC transporter permease [Acidimicrobiaceae bacterium]